MEKIAKIILQMIGWKVVCNVPYYPKSVICVAPHTSNWDFILGKLGYASTGRKTHFLMKETWFFFPLGCIFRAIGGIAVPRKRGSELTAIIIDKFNEAQRMNLAVTPEGTRSLTRKWRRGFLHIAMRANIPIILAYIDFAKKEMALAETFTPTGDLDADMAYIKKFYDGRTGRYPEKFCNEIYNGQDS
ncbi:MAG: 1-acyl-sn-glycerol-3-phosphate acyltransferase [Muribaculaceae bacterium]